MEGTIGRRLIGYALSRRIAIRCRDRAPACRRQHLRNRESRVSRNNRLVPGKWPGSVEGPHTVLYHPATSRLRFIRKTGANREKKEPHTPRPGKMFEKGCMGGWRLAVQGQRNSFHVHDDDDNDTFGVGEDGSEVKPCRRIAKARKERMSELASEGSVRWRLPSVLLSNSKTGAPRSPSRA